MAPVCLSSTGGGARTADAIGPVLADRMHRRGRDQLGRLVPVAAHEAAAPAFASVGAVARDRGERRHGIGRGLARRAPTLEQAAAHVRMLEPRGRIRVPRERCPARATARLMIRPVRIRARVVHRLALPRDQPVLDEHVPRARARAVDAMRGAHHLVMTPAVAIGRLPVTTAADEHAPSLGVRLTTTEELVRRQERRVTAHLGVPPWPLRRPQRTSWRGCCYCTRSSRALGR
jgi:hypothetical protein